MVRTILDGLLGSSMTSVVPFFVGWVDIIWWLAADSVDDTAIFPLDSGLTKKVIEPRPGSALKWQPRSRFSLTRGFANDQRLTSTPLKWDVTVGELVDWTL